jgi:hypothetical protein
MYKYLLSILAACVIAFPALAFTSDHGDGPCGPSYPHTNCSTGEQVWLYVGVQSSDSGTKGCILHEAVPKYRDLLPPGICDIPGIDKFCPLCPKSEQTPKAVYVILAAIVVIGIIIFVAVIFLVRRLSKRKAILSEQK